MIPLKNSTLSSGYYFAFKIRPFMIPSSFLLINYDIIKFLVFLLIHDIVRVWLTTTTILDVRGKVGFVSIINSKTGFKVRCTLNISNSKMVSYAWQNNFKMHTSHKNYIILILSTLPKNDSSNLLTRFHLVTYFPNVVKWNWFKVRTFEISCRKWGKINSSSTCNHSLDNGLTKYTMYFICNEKYIKV